MVSIIVFFNPLGHRDEDFETPVHIEEFIADDQPADEEAPVPAPNRLHREATEP